MDLRRLSDKGVSSRMKPLHSALTKRRIQPARHAGTSMLIQGAALAGALMVWACSHAAEPVRTKPLTTYAYGKSQSVRQELREAGSPAAEVLQQRFPAMVVNASTMKPIKATATFQIEKQPLLWLSEDKTQVVLDARYFDDLNPCDATRLSRGQEAVLGKIKPAARVMAPSQLADFLMSAGILQTYIHIESSLQLKEETVTKDGTHELHFAGTHLYFTNERNEDRLAFQFRLAPDGTVSVRGL